MGRAARAIVSIGLSFFLPGIGAAFGLGTFGTAVLGMVLNTGLTALAGTMFGGGETGSSGDNVRNSGILVNNSSSVTVLPVVYGTRRVGPKRVFVDTTGDDNKYIHMVMAVGEGEIFGIGNVESKKRKSGAASVMIDCTGFYELLCTNMDASTKFGRSRASKAFSFT